MKKLYQLLGAVLLGTQLFSSQVYKIATDGLYYPYGISGDGKVVLSSSAGYYLWDSVNGMKNNIDLNFMLLKN